ncbi:MAG: hypothetical protein ACE37H_03875 [Phycisphaeraceae bacterium]
MVLLFALCCMVGWAEPATAARLASVEGEAGETEVRDAEDFKLGDQTEVEISYKVTAKNDDCSVVVRLYREQNGRWLVVNTVLRTSSAANGSRTLTLPAGSYRVEVVAKQARYHVTVDN